VAGRARCAYQAPHEPETGQQVEQHEHATSGADPEQSAQTSARAFRNALQVSVDTVPFSRFCSRPKSSAKENCRSDRQGIRMT
jgi:hypothetical protein